MTVEELVQALQAIIDGAQGRDLSDEEAERYEALEKDLAVARRSQELRQRQTAYTTPSKALQTAAVTTDQEAEARAFDHYLRTGVARYDGIELRAQTEGVSTQGGYLVPDTFRQKLVEKLLAYGGLASNVESFNTSDGRPVEWPTLDDTANTGEIVQEGATFSSGADLVFGISTLGAYKYMSGGASNLPLKVSFELLQDSAFNVQDLLTRVFGTRIGRIQSTHWVTGTGSGQPQGLLTPKTGYAAIASTSVPTYAELLATIHALDPAYRANAKWLMNDNSLSKIQGIVDGAQRPLIWASTDDLASPGGESMPGSSMLGYPIVIDQAMPSIAASGSTKWLAFGDFTQAYVIRRVKDVTLVVLNELYAATGQVGFMAWARADGCVQDPNAYVVLTSHA